MCVRIWVSNDTVFVIEADFKDFKDAYQKALRGNVLIDVGEIGERKVINPQQILYIEEIDDADQSFSRLEKEVTMHEQPVPQPEPNPEPQPSPPQE